MLAPSVEDRLAAGLLASRLAGSATSSTLSTRRCRLWICRMCSTLGLLARFPQRNRRRLRNIFRQWISMRRGLVHDGRCSTILLSSSGRTTFRRCWQAACLIPTPEGACPTIKCTKRAVCQLEDPEAPVVAGTCSRCRRRNSKVCSNRCSASLSECATTFRVCVPPHFRTRDIKVLSGSSRWRRTRKDKDHRTRRAATQIPRTFRSPLPMPTVTLMKQPRVPR
mmetsp:Transcript_27815/g.91018  ORF Transcript_27815/g.91018 Transcript_27815/m.91018 type:complete len:223 (-) Transcript_27815:3114-3782(-)